jgi:hypothetical protein
MKPLPYPNRRPTGPPRRPIAFVLVVLALDPTRLHWQRGYDLSDELARTLIKAQARTLGVRRGFIEIEYVFHLRQVVTA